MRRICSIVLSSLILPAMSFASDAQAQVICTGNASPPPELPVYEQTPIPAPGYVWVPGYWGIGPVGYYWVPGTWVLPPSVGLLWTPGYWAWRDGIYVWNAGYWGPHVGFYGGVNYGYGYGGVGYEGGRWDNGVFIYNRTVNNFGNVTITHVYEKTVYIAPGASRVSFNGGSGGTTVRPTQEEQTAAHEQHIAAAPAQLQHERTASENKALLASENHGKPIIAATAKAGEFAGKGVVAAKGASTAGVPGAGPTNSPGANTFDERGRMGTAPTVADPDHNKSATSPAGAKVLEERGTTTGPSGNKPGAPNASTNPKTLEERGTTTGPSGNKPGAGNASSNPTGTKTFEERGSTGQSGTNPAANKLPGLPATETSATSPTGAKTLEERRMGNGPSGTNPAGGKSATNPPGPPAAGTSGTNPGSLGTLNQRGTGAERATLNGENAPRIHSGAPPLQPTPHSGGPSRAQTGAGQQQKNKDNKDKDH